MVPLLGAAEPDTFPSLAPLFRKAPTWSSFGKPTCPHKTAFPSWNVARASDGLDRRRSSIAITCAFPGAAPMIPTSRPPALIMSRQPVTRTTAHERRQLRPAIDGWVVMTSTSTCRHHRARRLLHQRAAPLYHP